MVAHNDTALSVWRATNWQQSIPPSKESVFSARVHVFPASWERGLPIAFNWIKHTDTGGKSGTLILCHGVNRRYLAGSEAFYLG